MDIREKIRIRDAHPDDAPFIAWAVLTAMEYDDTSEMFRKLQPYVQDIAYREDTLYSWRRTRVALIDNTVVGCLVSYDGGDYEGCWRGTWTRFCVDGEGFPEEELQKSAIETKAGEYYLDSLAVKKAFRGAGIGKLLLEDGIRKAKSLGFRRVTLIAETEAPQLREYYGTLGFRDGDTLKFFGGDYTRMAMDI